MARILRNLPNVRSRGFTLVELLVVMCIILILAGLLMTAVFAMYGQKDKKDAEALIGRLYLAIEDYKTTGPTGAYPLECENSTGKKYINYWVDDVVSTGGVHGILNVLEDYLDYDHEALVRIETESDFTHDSSHEGYYLTDGWGQPFFYDDGGDNVVDDSGDDTLTEQHGAEAWEEWGLTHPVKILSVGANNLNDDEDGPETWDDNTVIYQKIEDPDA